MAGCATDPYAPASEESAPLAPDGQMLRPTPLPDLSDMTAAVRDQIRKRYSSLTAAIEHPGTISELSEAYGEMGNVLMAARYGDAPEPFYLNAQALAPSDRRWPYYLGHLYTTRGAFAQAAASFEQALALRADDVPTLISLGEVHLAQGRPEAAEPLLTQALSLQPGSVWARIGLGRAASTSQDYIRAVEHLEEALAVDPQAANIHYPLAMAYRGLGELEKAEAHLQQRDSGTVRQPDPLMQAMRDSLQSPSAYEREGIQALGSGDWEAAAAAFRRGIELAPANPSLRHRLGTTLFMLGNEREGQAQFEEALRVSPEYAQAHYSLGLLMEGSGRIEEALHRFSTAVRHEPSYVEARLGLARLLRRTGRPNEALSEYAQVIAAEPRSTEAPFGYAMALVGLGRYQEARDRLEAGDSLPRRSSPKPSLPRREPIFARKLRAMARPPARRRARPRARSRPAAGADADCPAGAARAAWTSDELDLGKPWRCALAEVGQYAEAASCIEIIRWPRTGARRSRAAPWHGRRAGPELTGRRLAVIGAQSPELTGRRLAVIGHNHHEEARPNRVPQTHPHRQRTRHRGS